uniref:Uncharacterized protein AlNc14C36G3187 n=1 Tax=Albugo laibachii Nc14 TaxID=890382 RepID=F0W8R2_9STRA|nr:conserved hypothetical protein [Albugo laibachii Nc14]|eukprot:CCA17519.1 conserved hypothetical protein [Albugo laibachii Nc14]
MDQVLVSARYGHLDEIKLLLEDANTERVSDLVNYVDECTGNTPLHMACANGHLDCVQYLLQKEASHIANLNGNYPLHWAVQNKHLAIVKELLQSVSDMDVLAQNSFGRGCVTEAFQCEDAEILKALLEHPSASEDRLAKGSAMEKAVLNLEPQEEGEVIQETILEFDFGPEALTKCTLKARELALEWNREAFKTDASDDITGVSIWSASVILSHWIVENQALFHDISVLELGAGCGVSGLACYLYTDPKKVVLSDYFDSTVRNLKYNVDINRKAQIRNREIPEAVCSQCGVSQRCRPENPDGHLSLCAGCKTVRYCSRECQKQAWKHHKRHCQQIKQRGSIDSCQIDVVSLDWSQSDSWPRCEDSDTVAQYDIILGSDLVYHSALVPVLVNAIDNMLISSGQFIHLASQARDSLDQFTKQMRSAGFACTETIVPERYKMNPLVSSSTGNDVLELFDLHFSEMHDVYCLYIFQRELEVNG